MKTRTLPPTVAAVGELSLPRRSFHPQPPSQTVPLPFTDHILLVADDPDYAHFIQLAIQDAGMTNPVEVVSNGTEAVQYLKGQGPYADRHAYPIPGLVLLDLQTPPFTGLEVMRWIRHRPALDGLHVVLLTESESQGEARLARRLHADACLTKPSEFAALRKAMLQIRDCCAGEPVRR